MTKRVLFYGLLLGAFIFVLKLIQYLFIIYENSVEIYGGLVAVIFTGLGIWLGLKLTRNKEMILTGPEIVNNSQSFIADNEKLSELSITPREHEILKLIADGMSNQEIADKLFVSINTVKTHSSRLFEKLEVKRRTQAVQKAKELGLLV